MSQQYVAPHRSRLAFRRPDPAAFARRLRSLPLWVHLVPYIALGALCFALTRSGVVPQGMCEPYSAGRGAAGFIAWSAAAFAALAVLLMASAVVATFQRSATTGRSPSVGIAFAALVAGFAVIAGALPRTAVGQMAELVILVGVLALVPVAIGGLVAFLATVFRAVDQPERRRPWLAGVARYAAWATALTIVPTIMLLVYATVTPICFD